MTIMMNELHCTRTDLFFRISCLTFSLFKSYFIIFIKYANFSVRYLFCKSSLLPSSNYDGSNLEVRKIETIQKET